VSDGAQSVRLLPSGLTVRVPRGERLLDVLDELGPASGLPSACRAGNCAACLVRVVRGSEALAPAEPGEADTLRALGHANDRLGCQVRAAIATSGATEVVLRVLGGPPSA
jgi:ferredoxin